MGNIRSSVIDYLFSREGSLVTLKDLTTHTGRSEKQIQQSISSIRNGAPETSGGLDMKRSVQVVTAGQQWIYRPIAARDATPPTKNQNRSFREVGPTSDGELILQCEDGTLWKAVNL